MASEEVCLGTWRIVECVSLAGTVETTGIEGTEFILDEGGDVSWKIAEEAEPLPFFNCETYEVLPHKSFVPKEFNFIGSYAGLEVNFKVEVSDDLMLLTYERCCMLQCQKVSSPDPKDDVPYSFLGALEEGYFSDVVIKAESGQEFKAHSTILSLTTPNIDWSKTPNPLSGLPGDVIKATLHYLYAECLPRGLSEETAAKCVQMMAKIPELKSFMKLCDTFLKNTALKQQITSLVTDMHSSADKIIELFSGTTGADDMSTRADRSLACNPAKLCYVVKQAIREAAIALSKLLILCDLFSRRKAELSREERHDIIKYAKSRIPVFMKQWEKFLEVSKEHTTTLSADQRHEIATYLVPEIEQSLDIASKLVSDCKAALEQIISGSENEKTEKIEKTKKGHVGDVLGKTLKNALHVRELKKLKKLQERSTTSFFHFMQKKESFSTMSQGEKIRSVSKLLEQLVDAVQIGQMKIQELMSDIDSKLTWRDWKYIFKLGTSKISWGICKLLSNKPTIQPLVKQACDMVHKEEFTASVTSLGLLDSRVDHSSLPRGSPPSGACTSKGIPNSQKTKYVQLSSVESLCIPPYARDSETACRAVKLLQSRKHTDLVFEIVLAHERTHAITLQSPEEWVRDKDPGFFSSGLMALEHRWSKCIILEGNYIKKEGDRAQPEIKIGDTVIDHTSGEPVERTESEREVETYQIPAHRVVIAARCDWFRRALLSGMRESIDRKITVHDTNPELFRLFLEYVYSGQLDLNEMSTEQLADMITLADRYDTTSLKSCCEYALRLHVDDETALYLVSLADQLNAKVLKEAAMNFISDHPVLTSSEVFHDLPEHLQLEVEAVSLTSLESRPRGSSLHSHTETPSSVSSVSEIEEMMNNVDLLDRLNPEYATSSSSEDMLPTADSNQLTSCVEIIKGIVGDTIPHEELVQAALAADCDANRALNFLFA